MIKLNLKTLFVAAYFSCISFNSLAYIKSDKLAVNSINGDHVVATVSFPNPVTGDLYVAVQTGGHLYFIGQGASLSLTPLAFMSNMLFTADITVLDIPSVGIAPGSYLMYQIVTMPGTDPINVNNWIGGLNSLSNIAFSINLANSPLVPTQKPIPTPTSKPVPVLNGSALFKTNCGNCHYSSQLGGLSASGISQAIRRVKRMNSISLSSSQMTAIANFLATQ